MKSKRLFYLTLVLGIVYLISKIILSVEFNIPDYIFVILFISLFVYQYLQTQSELNKLNKMHKDEIEYVTHISEALRSTLELDEVLKIALEILSKKLAHRKIFLYLTDKLDNKDYLKCIGYPEAIFLDGISSLNIYLHPEEVLNRRKNAVETIFRILKLTEFSVVPITSRSKPIGMIIFGGDISRYNPASIEIFANQIGLAIENAQLYEKTKEFSVIDELTKVYNRRFFDQRLVEELNLAKRYNSSLSLAMIDIDDFKHYNDTNGHLAGDMCLMKIAQLLSKKIFSVDIIARYGGEEFVIILPGTDKQNSIIAGQKFCSTISDYQFDHGEKQPLGKVTISVGLATYPEDAQDANSLISCADKALYEAKRTGKNKACVYIKSLQ